MSRPIPIFRLRRQARLLSREKGMPLHVALDQIARQNGFRNWSRLIAERDRAPALAAAVLDRLRPGDLVLLGARPWQGKTRLGIDIVAEATLGDRHGHVFSSACTMDEVQQQITGHVDASRRDAADGVRIATPSTLDADRIIDGVAQSGDPAPGDVVLVDYLQTLDHRRATPPIETQVRALRDFARETGVIIVTLSQIDPGFDADRRPLPDLRDVRRPNPLDLGLFSRTCFLQGRRIALPAA